MTAVMIGIDPHKGSHTAVAISGAEEPLGRLRVPAGADQAGRLRCWAQAWPERTWAVEGATGLGHLLAQQLVAAGERVLDIQPKLAARVRVLEAGNTSKNDPNDALSVAVAALRSRACREVTADDHAAVLRMRSRRHQDLGQARNQAACRLHAVLCDLVPGGLAKEITAAQAAAIIERAAATGPVGQARRELAAELLADLRRLDAQMRESKNKLAAVVRASGTSVTGLFGVGPVVAAIVIGDAGAVTRFPSRDHFAAWNGTAPVEVSSAARRSTGCRGAGTGRSTTPSTSPRSPRSGTSTAQAAPTTTRRSPRARHPRKHCAPSSGGSATPSRPGWSLTPAKPQQRPRTREGNRGTTLTPARPALTPNTGSSDKPLPGLATTLRPRPAAEAVPGIPRPSPPCRRRSRRPR